MTARVWGLKVDQAKRFEEFEQENPRLQADAEIDKPILTRAARPNFLARHSDARRSSTCGTNWA